MLPLPLADTHTPPIRAMALHALGYCQRLFYLEEVEEIRVADARVFAGRELHTSLEADDDVSAEEAMSPGPSTVRPSIGTDALVERMRARKMTSYVITTSDGRLVGLVRRDELEQPAG